MATSDSKHNAINKPKFTIMKKMIFMVALFLTATHIYAQPTGTIISFAGPQEKVPRGWVICDGTLYDRTRPEYRALFNAIGVTWGGDGANRFAVPDLQGLFLRGVSSGQPTDPDKDAREVSRPDLNAQGNRGNMVGSKQRDMFESHSHSYTDRQEGAGNDVERDRDVGLNKVETKNTANAGGSETRPKNAYVYFLIKL
jgi:microcystin-dependent protein